MDDVMDGPLRWAAGNMATGSFFEDGSEASVRAHAEASPADRSVLFGWTPESDWQPREQFAGGEWGPAPAELHLDVPRPVAPVRPSRARKSAKAAR